MIGLVVFGFSWLVSCDFGFFLPPFLFSRPKVGLAVGLPLSLSLSVFLSLRLCSARLPCPLLFLSAHCRTLASRAIARPLAHSPTPPDSQTTATQNDATERSFVALQNRQDAHVPPPILSRRLLVLLFVVRPWRDVCTLTPRAAEPLPQHPRVRQPEADGKVRHHGAREWHR